MELAIITGASKGLGEALATLFLEAGVNVLGISRSENNTLVDLAATRGVTYHHVTYDLTDVGSLEAELARLGATIFTESLTKLYVVNNAAAIEPINQAMAIKSQSLIDHVNINTLAPMIILNSFLKQANHYAIPLVGVTITSGAATRAVYGWSAYCSTKASINMYTKTVALEQVELATGHKVIAFSPGIMDTAMQGRIRASSEAAFKEVADFIHYKETDQLQQPVAVAKLLIDLLCDETLESGKVYYARDYL